MLKKLVVAAMMLSVTTPVLASRSCSDPDLKAGFIKAHFGFIQRAMDKESQVYLPTMAKYYGYMNDSITWFLASHVLPGLRNVLIEKQITDPDDPTIVFDDDYKMWTKFPYKSKQTMICLGGITYKIKDVGDFLHGVMYRIDFDKRGNPKFSELNAYETELLLETYKR